MICQDFNLSHSFFPCCLGFSISHQKKTLQNKRRLELENWTSLSTFLSSHLSSRIIFKVCTKRKEDLGF